MQPLNECWLHPVLIYSLTQPPGTPYCPPYSSHQMVHVST